MPFFKNRKKIPRPVQSRPYCAAIVPAAGTSSRMGGGDKLFTVLGGRPLLAHTLTALQNSASIDEIVIATRADSILLVYDICKMYGVTKASKVIRGGGTRSESVRLALGEVSRKARLAAVHDGARPLVRPQEIDAVVARAAQCGAAILAVPLKDTIKEVKNDASVRTPDRSHWRAAQTPQVFDIALLRGALLEAARGDVPVTDDSMAVERLGMPVQIVEGRPDNIKATTPEDFTVIAALLEERHAADRTGI